MELFNTILDPWREAAAHSWWVWILLGAGVLTIVGSTVLLVLNYDRRWARESLVDYGKLMPKGVFLLLAGLTAGSYWQFAWFGLVFFWDSLCMAAGRIALGWSRYRQPLALFQHRRRLNREMLGPPANHDDEIVVPAGTNARLTLQLAEANGYIHGEHTLPEGPFPDHLSQVADDDMIRYEMIFRRQWYFSGTQAGDTASVLLQVSHYSLPDQSPAVTPAGFNALINRILMAEFFQSSLLHGSSPSQAGDLRFELNSGTPVVSIEFPESVNTPYHVHFIPLGRDGALRLTFTCCNYSEGVDTDVLERFAREQARRWTLDDPEAATRASDWTGFQPSLTDHNDSVRVKLDKDELKRLFRRNCEDAMDWVAFEHSSFYYQWMEQQCDQYEFAFREYQQAAIEQFYTNNLAAIEKASAQVPQKEEN